MRYEVIQTHAGPYKKGDVLGEEHIAAAGATVEDWLRLKAVKETDPGRTPAAIIRPESTVLPIAAVSSVAAPNREEVKAVVGQVAHEVLEGVRQDVMTYLKKLDELRAVVDKLKNHEPGLDADAVRAIVREEIAAVLTELQGAPADQAPAGGKPPKNS